MIHKQLEESWWPTHTWLEEFGPFYDVSCVTFARSLSPAEALVRLGAANDAIREVTFEELQERAMRCFDSGVPRASYAGALEADGWSVLIQLWTGSIAVDFSLVKQFSQGTEVVSINRNIHATDYFVYAANGELVTWFDLLGPDACGGSEPDRLTGMMREVGLDPELDEDSPDLKAGFPRAFALAEKITGFPFTGKMLDTHLLGAVINSG
ncbi:DUF6461 domain-containing protein [Streptosporangium saharense]|uniref:Uncharacterized protein n=1 Tax=Streptosporangium saharense TaxID=1706840 RepID=A0A7W7VNL0_9ACTN|nr:DUF6461 domain-containing protein [Streptosporangium saharense]MBB4917011.1 hypothetical protein [Streptosporangium saharense]